MYITRARSSNRTCTYGLFRAGGGHVYEIKTLCSNLVPEEGEGVHSRGAYNRASTVYVYSECMCVCVSMHMCDNIIKSHPHQLAQLTLYSVNIQGSHNPSFHISAAIVANHSL